jgi:DNA invertase Pin-like site-specific DNA recombinase
MTTVGYARVSTGQQNYETQVDRLTAAGATKVFTEKRSGMDGERAELARCMEYVREGDLFLVTKLDRLARSTSDLYRIVTELTKRGVAFKVLDDDAVDTSTRTGKLVMCAFRSIRPAIPITSGHLNRSIRPPLFSGYEA